MVEMLFGAERVVYYLPAAKNTLDDLDGSREKGIRQSTEKFLSSPDSAFDKSIRAHLRQVRDLNTNTRAFATWCQNEDAGKELCVVHDIYRKRNESVYFAKTDEFNREGASFKQEFSQLSEGRFEAWLVEADTDSKVLLVKE